MTGARGPASIAGTIGAYDRCPWCGHARVKHARPPAEGCTEPVHVTVHTDADTASAKVIICGCPLNRDFPQEVP